MNMGYTAILEQRQYEDRKKIDQIKEKYKNYISLFQLENNPEALIDLITLVICTEKAHIPQSEYNETFNQVKKYIAEGK